MKRQAEMVKIADDDEVCIEELVSIRKSLEFQEESRGGVHPLPKYVGTTAHYAGGHKARPYG